MKQFEGKNYYDILGVSRTATLQEIRSAFHEIAKVYHPDSNFYSEIVEAPLSTEQVEAFKLITDAYQTLISIEKRARYDAALAPRLRDWEDTSNETYLNEIFSEKTFKFQEAAPRPGVRRPTFGCDIRPNMTGSAIDQEMMKGPPETPQKRRGPHGLQKWVAEFFICMGFGLMIGAVLYLVFHR